MATRQMIMEQNGSAMRATSDFTHASFLAVILFCR